MILLDTNHVGILRLPPSQRQTRLVERMTLSHDQTFGIPIVAVEETMRGWLAAIAKERLARRQVPAYRELSRLFEFFATFPNRAVRSTFGGFVRLTSNGQDSDLNARSENCRDRDGQQRPATHGQSARSRESTGSAIR